MKKTVLVLAIVSLLALGGSAFARIGTIDQVPAATILIPYFEVDIAHCTGNAAGTSGSNTLFTVSNASAAPIIAHATVWSDWSVPVLDFDIYLTGYDVQSVNMGDVLCNGNLPVTGPGYSNNGLFSDSNFAAPDGGNFNLCNQGASPGQAPVYANPAVTFIDIVRDRLTGQQAAGFGTCDASGAEGTDIAIGYITLDSTTNCSTDFPSDTGYFDGDVAVEENVLWADYFYVDPTNNFAQAFNAVHIEADGAANYLADDITFYGRYVGGDGSDGREPLPTTWAARYGYGGTFNRSDLYVWREGDSNPGGWPCGGVPSWWPLNQYNTTGGGAIIVFDEAENPTVVTTVVSGGPPGETIEIPNETNRVQVGVELPTGGNPFGWIYMNLQSSRTIYGVIDGNVGYGQAWVSTVLSASGRFSGGWHGTPLDYSTNQGVPINEPFAGPTASNPGS
jgi:hypothetical protein